MYAVGQNLKPLNEDVGAVAGELRQVMNELLPLGSALLSTSLAQAFEIPCSDIRTLENNRINGTQAPNTKIVQQDECSSNKKQNKKPEIVAATAVPTGTDQGLKTPEQSVGPYTRTVSTAKKL
eukprot:TRINITY_DN12752_c1_g3_i4.p5 TRINITY_DN12752_c1_g3~~TRINITY_DN12752_c1_g3_i4.p5  ORF type:complete len:141 (-),score=12.91 TRINITY_DN12752_c1_g3_i4:568-936(-)